MLTRKCSVVCCDREVSKELTITYRSKYNTIVTSQIYFCDQCTLEDLLDEVTPEMKLKCGGW